MFSCATYVLEIVSRHLKVTCGRIGFFEPFKAGLVSEFGQDNLVSYNISVNVTKELSYVTSI